MNADVERCGAIELVQQPGVLHTPPRGVGWTCWTAYPGGAKFGRPLRIYPGGWDGFVRGEGGYVWNVEYICVYIMHKYV